MLSSDFCLLCLQACYARVLDYRRKFIEAAARYNELSYKTVIAEAERMTALKNALICTILASAGKFVHTTRNLLSSPFDIAVLKRLKCENIFLFESYLKQCFLRN